MCRFILNLRQVRPAGSSFIDGEQSVSLRFMGNMGESLHFGGEEEDGNLDHCSSCVEDSPNAAVDLLTDANVAGNGQLIAGMSVSLTFVDYTRQRLIMYYVSIMV